MTGNLLNTTRVRLQCPSRNHGKFWKAVVTEPPWLPFELNLPPPTAFDSYNRDMRLVSGSNSLTEPCRSFFATDEHFLTYGIVFFAFECHCLYCIIFKLKFLIFFIFYFLSFTQRKNGLQVDFFIFSFNSQHWVAYDSEFQSSSNVTERGKLHFSGLGAPKKEDNYAFCQVGIFFLFFC